MASSNGRNPLIQAEGLPKVLSFRPFRILPAERRIERDGKPAALGSRAFDLLCLLISRPGEVVSKADMMAKVAIALAHRLARDFRDGVRFVDFGSLKPEIRRFGSSKHCGIDKFCWYSTIASMSSMGSRDWPRRFIGMRPAVSILATSRESLDAASEFVVELAPLEIPAEDLRDAFGIDRYSSLRLFVECAVAGYRGPISDVDAEMIVGICRKLDGVPLAIEFVASRLSAHSLIEIDELIEGRLRLAWRGRRTAPLRHQSLSAALDWSYDHISPVERSLLEYLSVFPGAFTLQGACAVAGDLAEPHVILQALEQLVAKSLVTSGPRAAQARFRLLETTRAYARDKLAASGAAQRARLRHANHVLEALTPRTYEPGGQRPGGWTQNCSARRYALRSGSCVSRSETKLTRADAVSRVSDIHQECTS